MYANSFVFPDRGELYTVRFAELEPMGLHQGFRQSDLAWLMCDSNSVEGASIDVGSNAGNFPGLAGNKRLPEVGYQSTSGPQAPQTETCTCLSERGPGFGLLVNVTEREKKILWTLHVMTMGVAPSPGSGSPDLGNFWWGEVGLPKPNQHIAGCFLLADTDIPVQDALVSWPHHLLHAFPLPQTEPMEEFCL